MVVHPCEQGSPTPRTQRFVHGMQFAGDGYQLGANCETDGHRVAYEGHLR